MSRRSSWALACITALAVAAPPAFVVAQDDTNDPTREAAQHFDRGISFFNEARYDAALAEFSRAYELAPAHQTLYNLARVHAALGHAVEAARAYERYLHEAGDEIRGRRRREAERALEEQRARIGRLVVRTDVDGARIALDGVDVATTPLPGPLAVSAGSHTVEVRAPGRETVRRAVAVAGQEEVVLDVALREEVIPRGTLHVTASVPEVGIAIDGEPIGVTPLASTVPLRAGEHVVSAARPGYRPESRRVTIEDGAAAEVRFDMRRAPDPAPDEIGRLRLRLPDAPYLIRVDGEPMIGFELELPIGAHTIELEVTDRQPYQGTLRVPPGGVLAIAPPLSWTLDARRQRLEEASRQRTLGTSLTIAGGALFVGGLAVLVWNEVEIARTDALVLETQADYQQYMGGVGCDSYPDDARCVMLRQQGEQLNDEQSIQNIIRVVSVSSSIVGAILAAIGIPVWATTPSNDDVDSDARVRAELRIGPGSAELLGSF